MPLAAPPADLAGFPFREETLPGFRISTARAHDGSEIRTPWHFNAEPPGLGRFDLPVPRGTCYWSDRPIGAFVEVFRGAAVIARRDVTSRNLWRATLPARHWADLAARTAYRFGMTAAIWAQPDYELPQAWSKALDAAGFDGLIARCSHDPAARARNLAVFGSAGVAGRRPAGSSPATKIRLDRFSDLNRVLRSLGVAIVDPPHDVAISKPPG